MYRYLTIAVAVFGLAALGCAPGAMGKDGDNTARAETQRVTSIVPVTAVLPIRDSISEYAQSTERVEAENEVDVTSEVMGRCIEVNFEEGQSVAKGDVLVRLDNKEQQAQLRQQEAQLNSAQRDFDRAKELYKHGLNSEQEYDSAASTYQQQVESVNQTKEQLTKYTVRAPISGKITMKDVQLGEIVSSGTPIYKIVDPTSFMLKVPVDETELPRLSKGQRALVTIDALGEEKFETKVRRVNEWVSESGTVDVILDFNKEDLSKLRDSAFARIELIMETHDNALLVPKEAVVEDNARTYVFVVREVPEEEWPSASDGPIFKARRVEVTTGLENSEYVEILEGVEDGDRVVTYGQQTLKSDSLVKVTSAEVELESAGDVTAEEALEIAEARKARGTTNRSMIRAGGAR